MCLRLKRGCPGPLRIKINPLQSAVESPTSHNPTQNCWCPATQTSRLKMSHAYTFSQVTKSCLCAFWHWRPLVVTGRSSSRLRVTRMLIIHCGFWHSVAISFILIHTWVNSNLSDCSLLQHVWGLSRLNSWSFCPNSHWELGIHKVAIGGAVKMV